MVAQRGWRTSKQEVRHSSHQTMAIGKETVIVPPKQNISNDSFEDKSVDVSSTGRLRTVMMSEMPRTPCRSTSSATRNASVTGMFASTAARPDRCQQHGASPCTRTCFLLISPINVSCKDHCQQHGALTCTRTCSLMISPIKVSPAKVSETYHNKSRVMEPHILLTQHKARSLRRLHRAVTYPTPTHVLWNPTHF